MMDCRQCNYYLCDECHPQQKEKDDWFWGSVSYFMDQATQEVTEITAEFQEMAGEFETFMSDMAFTSCGVVDGKQFKADELQFDAKADKKPRKPDSQKRSKSAKRNAPEAPQKEKKAEEDAAAASGAEADEEDGVMKAPSTPQAAAVSKKSAQSKCFADERANAKTEAKAKGEVPTPAAAVAEVVAPPPPIMEDLLDIGQNDLLDLDLEPVASAKKEQEVAPPAPSKAGSQIAVSAAAAHQDLLDLDLGLSGAAQPATTTAEVDLLPDVFR